MIRIVACSLALLLLSSHALAEDGKEEGDKLVSGMSIVGNDEAPKALVIVPWKSSGLGDTLDVSQMMNDGLQPVDREVFGRSLDYYEIRTGLK
jgi:hypothetical protein